MRPTMTSALSALLLSSPMFAQPPAGAVACYSFNGNANDNSGNGHHGTVNGALLTFDRSGIANQAYAFDGVTDHIAVPGFDSFNIAGEVSTGMWVRAIDAGGNFAVSIWPDVFTDRFAAAPFYGHNGGSTVFWDFGNAASGGRLSVIPYAISTGWEHFTFTSSSVNNRMRVYRNGNMIAEEFHSSVIVNANRILALGGGNVSGYSHWHGDLDEIVLYPRELSATEVSSLYSFGAPCANMVGLPEVAINTPTIWIDQAAQNLVMSLHERSTLQVVDVAGRSVHEQQLMVGSQLWSYAGLPSAAYIVRIASASGSFAQRIMVGN